MTHTGHYRGMDYSTDPQPESWPEVRKRLESDSQDAGGTFPGQLDIKAALTRIDELERALRPYRDPCAKCGHASQKHEMARCYDCPNDDNRSGNHYFVEHVARRLLEDIDD